MTLGMIRRINGGISSNGYEGKFWSGEYLRKKGDMGIGFRIKGKIGVDWVGLGWVILMISKFIKWV